MPDGTPTWDDQPITWLDDIDSTNTWMAAAAREGAPDGSVVVARHQRAGRGRFDRTWEAPPDSALLMTVLVRPPRSLAPARWHLLNLVMALAVTDAAGPAAQLKWPNDVIVPRRDDRKLAGILSEAMHPEHAVIIGVGLNRARPAQVAAALAERAIWLDEIDVEIGLRPLAQQVLAAFARWRAMLENGDVEVIDEYRRRCTTIGREVEVQLANREVRGEAVAVDDDGQLHVRDGDGELHIFNAGDVVHARTHGTL